MTNSSTKKQQLRIVIVGHVDHGKSTLIGRLLYETDSLPTGKLEELQQSSGRRGMDLEWSFVLDAFQAERDQAITIDTTQIWFRTNKRDYVIIDAPGHREFLKNMISGAAQADAAILVVDAEEGVKEQTRRHAYLLSLLGLKQIAVVVNKMDLIDYNQDRFNEVKKEITEYLEQIGVVPSVIIPIAARHGLNLAKRAEETPWYKGDALLSTLDKFETSRPLVEQPLRFPIQDVYRYDEQRILVGRIESGTVKVGDTVMFSPSNRTAKVTSIEVWNEKPTQAVAGECVGISLDQPIFVERGDIASHVEKAPILTNVFRMRLFWLGDEPLQVGQSLRMKLTSSEAKVTVQSIDKVVDTQDLKNGEKTTIQKNDVAEVTLRSREMIALDEYTDFVQTGRAVLYNRYDVVGAGILNMDGYADLRQTMTIKSKNIYEVEHLMDHNARAWRNGHKGTVIWFTGLSGAGKSTLAMEVEKRLFQKGLQTYVLDGDNVRHGLNSDLGFSPEDRNENIRRVGEVASLMADAGMIVLTAFISPYRSDRARARNSCSQGFHEVYIKASLESCEKRDPKGLYVKARSGEIKEFTGISSPYEAPDNAELIVDTESYDVETCVRSICDYIQRETSLEISDKKVEVA